MSKEVIREGCHETNSSSMHSICIMKRDGKVTKEDFNSSWENPDYIYIHDGKWRLYDLDDDFGRSPFQMLYTFEDKLRYAICSYMGYLYPDDPEFTECYNMFNDLVYEITGAELDWGYETPFDIYLDENGNEIHHRDLIYSGWSEENDMTIYKYKDENGVEHLAKLDEENVFEAPRIGMIDHQSVGLLQNFLKETGITLKEFLVSKKFVVVIDGDEYYEFYRLKAAKIINVNDIVTEYKGYDKDPEWLAWLKENEK